MGKINNKQVIASLRTVTKEKLQGALEENKQPLVMNQQSRGFPRLVPLVKNLPVSAGGARDAGWIPGSGIYSGVGNDNPLRYSCLENSMDRGIWWATVYGVAKSQTLLNPHHTASHCSRVGVWKCDILGEGGAEAEEGKQEEGEEGEGQGGKLFLG